MNKKSAQEHPLRSVLKLDSLHEQSPMQPNIEHVHMFKYNKSLF